MSSRGISSIGHQDMNAAPKAKRQSRYSRTLLYYSNILKFFYKFPMPLPSFLQSSAFRLEALRRIHINLFHTPIVSSNGHPLSNIMKLVYALIPLVGITAAVPAASPNPSAELSVNAATQLFGKRTSCSQNGVTGTCVDTNDGNPCPNGFLITGLCPGANSEICCFNNPSDCHCN